MSDRIEDPDNIADTTETNVEMTPVADEEHILVLMAENTDEVIAEVPFSDSEWRNIEAASKAQGLSIEEFLLKALTESLESLEEKHSNLSKNLSEDSAQETDES